MSYSALSVPKVGVMWTEAEYEQVRANFAAGIPDVYTAPGQIAAATGSQALGLAATWGEGKHLVTYASAGCGLAWTGGGVPIGMIIIWSGSAASIPGGWHLCDGTEGTVNLQNRFVLGGGDGWEGVTGGSKSADLASIDLAHTHTYVKTTGSGGASHQHTQGASTGGLHVHGTDEAATGVPLSTGTSTPSGSPLVAVATDTHTHNLPATTALGTAHTHANQDVDSGSWAHDHATTVTTSALTTYKLPLYALCYIQRIS